MSSAAGQSDDISPRLWGRSFGHPDASPGPEGIFSDKITSMTTLSQ